MARFAALAALILAAGAAAALAGDAPPTETALDRYIAKPDDSYSWKVIKADTQGGLRTFVLDMVSQTWRTGQEVNRTKWQHWLTVAVPAQVQSDIGFLYIGGGSNGGAAPDGPPDIVRRIAQATGTVVAELKMVPNQPLVFHGDGQGRVEDDLVAYTWDQFLKTGDATWPARNPMVKSAVRAMDTITQLMASAQGGKRSVDRFVVAGGSKRGWTTWLTGAVDKRVVAICPIVIDVLNVQKSMLHHFAAYGFWAPSIGDYVAHGITARMNDPRMAELCQLVDPYAYRQRLTMPKFIVNAAGDQFFLPDSSRFYFDDLPGEKLLRYVPNADHGLKGTDALESLVAFHWMIVTGHQRPKFSWSFEEDGTIRVQAEDRPQRVLQWQATNPDARDFRLESLGPKYTSQPLQDQGDGLYVTAVNKPKKGWTAFFVELTYDVGGPVPAKFTTSVRIVPDVLPHADEDATRPATIAVHCTAPSEAAARAIQQQANQIFQAARGTGAASPWSHAARPEAAGSGGRGGRRTHARRGQQSRRVRAEQDSAEAWGRVERSGRMLDVRWRPSGNLRASATGMTEWLKGQGCDDFAYRLGAGL